MYMILNLIYEKHPDCSDLKIKLQMILKKYKEQFLVWHTSYVNNIKTSFCFVVCCGDYGAYVIILMEIE